MSARRSTTWSNSGFTLIELLVVISIIALLIGILLPALGAARKTAQVLACGTRQQQIGRALAVYQNDYDSYYPTQTFRSSELGGNQELTWDDQLGRAGYDGRSIKDGDLDFSAPEFDLYVCPLDDLPQAFGNARRTYGLSYLQTDAAGERLVGLPGLSGWRGAVQNGVEDSPNRISVRAEDVQQSSFSIAIGEVRAWNGFSTSANILGRRNFSDVRPFFHWPNNVNVGANLGHHAVADDGNVLGVAGIDYRPNYLYCDGHVENISNLDVFEGVTTFNFKGTPFDHAPQDP